MTIAAPPFDDARARWFVSGRWISVAASLATVLLGQRTGAAAPWTEAAAIALLITVTNVVILLRVRSARTVPVVAAGVCLAIDIALMTSLLARSGGVLNPMAVFFLVEVVFAALVLGRAWAWGIAALSAAGYAVLFVSPDEDLHAAQTMHPAIGAHMQGMWLAFALTAVALAFLATRLVRALEQSHAEVERLRERSSRFVRAQSLATAVAGAAHELSSPLATVAIAAREMEHALPSSLESAHLRDDLVLIQSQITRCREILDQMGGQVAGHAGEAPRDVRVIEVLHASLHLLSMDDRRRVALEAAHTLRTRWPPRVLERVLRNLIHNGLQASTPGTTVNVSAALVENGIYIEVRDRGVGMTEDLLARVGEPFFTTKAPGAGLGLGVFVAKTSLEAMGGWLRISSTPREGTTVAIWLPSDVTADTGMSS